MPIVIPAALMVRLVWWKDNASQVVNVGCMLVGIGCLGGYQVVPTGYVVVRFTARAPQLLFLKLARLVRVGDVPLRLLPHTD